MTTKPPSAASAPATPPAIPLPTPLPTPLPAPLSIPVPSRAPFATTASLDAAGGASARESLDDAGIERERNRPARLVLEDGAVFHGDAFGVDRPGGTTAIGEAVFTTSMTGYQEALTDPSYTGQILVFTSSMIGNTGANAEDEESAKVAAAALVVRNLATLHSNYRATSSLSGYLARHGVLGIAGVDTRAITRRLRTGGAMRACVSDSGSLSDAELLKMVRASASMAGRNLVPLVGCATGSTWSETLGDWVPRLGGPAEEGCGESGAGKKSRKTVLALDCGAKRNILRHLAQLGCRVEVAPHDIGAAEILRRYRAGEIDGVFLSNGPGDPAAVSSTVATMREVLLGSGGKEVPPVFGICLGHQILALALGARTYKLKFGHRGTNQPVLNLVTGRVEITSQNHGFCVDPDSLLSLNKDGGLPIGVCTQQTHVHLNDGTMAGFRCVGMPVFCVQYHPEASPGPHESGYLFETFVRLMDSRGEVEFARSGEVVGV